MDLEARSTPAGTKASLLAKIREYKNDLNSLKTELKRLQPSYPNANAARDELLESGRADAMQVAILPTTSELTQYYMYTIYMLISSC